MPDHTDHYAPHGLRTRGTVIVVPGRGESTATYERFARRLAADAYRVRVIAPPEIDARDVPGSLAAFRRLLADAVEGAVTHADLARPLVLLGADTGAAAVSAVLGHEQVGQAWWPDAVVLAGIPGCAASSAPSWEAELDQRTACPVHRTVLGDDPAARRGALTQPVPRVLLDAAYTSTVDLPRLVLIGDADPLADRQALAGAVAALSRARLTVVRGAHHDVLNDLQHRSVAAEVVTFLEVLRNELVPVLAVESSAW